MGARAEDIFGRADRVTELATPGSYGQAPQGFRLPGSTRLGPVSLQVADLARSFTFYQDVLGLRQIERDGLRLVLAAADDRPLIELRERRGARPVPRRGALGLYHVAILLPERASLGQLVRHLGEIDARAGAADHLVSESLYLQDPDNLGIEVYADRPRSTWRRVGTELMMATDPLDIAGLLQAAGTTAWEGMPRGTTMGHVHLHVGNLDQARAFYSEAVGFDRTVWHYPGALFLAAGGYHHHLGTNTWAGGDAVPAVADDAQLLDWTLELPDRAAVSTVETSLQERGYSAEWHEGNLVTRDPWGTRLTLLSSSV